MNINENDGSWGAAESEGHREKKTRQTKKWKSKTQGKKSDSKIHVAVGVLLYDKVLISPKKGDPILVTL